MRDIYKALAGFEAQFEEVYGLSLNEAMILCALQEAQKEMTSTDLSARTEMGTSHTSKVIRTVDKRQMYFSLTPKGEKQLEAINLEKVEVPEMLKPLL